MSRTGITGSPANAIQPRALAQPDQVLADPRTEQCSNRSDNQRAVGANYQVNRMRMLVNVGLVICCHDRFIQAERNTQE